MCVWPSSAVFPFVIINAAFVNYLAFFLERADEVLLALHFSLYALVNYLVLKLLLLLLVFTLLFKLL